MTMLLVAMTYFFLAIRITPGTFGRPRLIWHSGTQGSGHHLTLFLFLDISTSVSIQPCCSVSVIKRLFACPGSLPSSYVCLPIALNTSERRYHALNNHLYPPVYALPCLLTFVFRFSCDLGYVHQVLTACRLDRLPWASRSYVLHFIYLS